MPIHILLFFHLYNNLAAIIASVGALDILKDELPEGMGEGERTGGAGGGGGGGGVVDSSIDVFGGTLCL